MENSKILGVLLGISLIFLVTTVNSANKISKTKKADVRLLIDISGSMKKNDPNNLRIPALQLVTNLLPKGADAGVWAFGRYVNMMVPLSSVDAKWQITATNTATKINSAGLYTNIGSVLEKSSSGWTAPNSLEKRSIILLTDGMVDISKDPTVNANERERILNVVLPRLKKAGIAIHTIALSQNADHELLKQLSTQTDGWYQSVNNASELQKVFLKIFEQAADRDNLPIVDNQFSVDKSIDEMTVLVFRKDSTSPAKLELPNGKIIDKGVKDSSVRWFSTEGYDLITLQKPETGKWKINAQVDPDNRVMVVSKLGLSIGELPNNLLAGEAINYEMQLLEDGSLISNSDFLSLINAKLEQNIAEKTNKLAMFYDGASYTFKQNFFTDSVEGELKLILSVTSPTFERTRSHAINIYGSPLVSEVEISPDNVAPHKIHLTVRKDIVRPSSLVINATVIKPDGEKSYIVVENPSMPIEINAVLTGGDYSVEFTIAGESIMGRSFSVNPDALKFSSIVKNDVQVPEINPIIPIVDDNHDEIETESEIEQPKANNPIEVEESQPTLKEESAIEVSNDQEESAINWLYIGIGTNLFLGVAGFFVWRLIKKRSTANASKVASELELDEDDEDESDEQDNDNDERKDNSEE